jgi:hypothetical protein
VGGFIGDVRGASRSGDGDDPCLDRFGAMIRGLLFPCLCDVVMAAFLVDVVVVGFLFGPRFLSWCLLCVDVCWIILSNRLNVRSQPGTAHLKGF